MTNYLFKFRFNSYQESGRLPKPIKKSILVSSKNKFKVLFVRDKYYSHGILLNFSGLNTNLFYSLVQKRLIDWEIFYSGVLC